MSYKKRVFFILSVLVMGIPLESRATTEQKNDKREDVREYLRRINDSNLRTKDSVVGLREDMRLAKEGRENRADAFIQEQENLLKIREERENKFMKAIVQNQNDQLKKIDRACKYVKGTAGVVVVGVVFQVFKSYLSSI